MGRCLSTLTRDNSWTSPRIIQRRGAEASTHDSSNMFFRRPGLCIDTRKTLRSHPELTQKHLDRSAGQLQPTLADVIV